MKHLSKQTTILGGLVLLAASGFAQTPAVPVTNATAGVNAAVTAPPVVVVPPAGTAAAANVNTGAAAQATAAVNAAAADTAVAASATTSPVPRGPVAANMSAGSSQYLAMDTNHDGLVSAQEFVFATGPNAESNALATIPPPKPAKQHWWSRKAKEPAATDTRVDASASSFDKFDTDHDGYLNDAEFEVYLRATRR